MKKFIIIIPLIIMCLMYLVGCKNTNYTVSFKDFDGKLLLEVNVKKGNHAIAPDEPFREGYTFSRWDKDFNNINENLIVTAQYKVNKYNVTFKNYDGTILKVEQVEYSKNATPPVINREGYKFVGWDKSHENIKEDLELVPLFQKEMYTVTYIGFDNQILKSIEVEYMEEITPPVAPIIDNYVFVKWEPNIDLVTSDLEIKAIYELVKFDVTFIDYNDEIIKQEKVEYGKGVNKPESPSREGFQFIGWDKEFSVIKEDITIKAIYEPIYLDIIFKNYNDEIILTKNVQYGSSIVFPEGQTRKGYTFIGWDKSLDNIKTNLEIKPIYQIIEYSINFKKNYSGYNSAEWNSKLDFINEFYYDFFNWIKNNYQLLNGFTYQNNIYTYKKNDKTINFSSFEEILALDKYDFEKTLANLIYKPFNRIDNNPIEIQMDNNYFLNSSDYLEKYRNLDQYFLKVINTSYTSYNTGYNQTSDGRVQIFFRFQQWAKNEAQIPAFNTLPLKYVLENEGVGEIIMPTTLKFTILDDLILPIPTSSKLHFIGWYDNSLGAGNKYISINGLTDDITLYAMWDSDPFVHKLIFLDDLGNIITEQNLTAENQLIPPTITKLGYNFIGWDKDISNIKEDTIFTAIFEIINYSITYIPNINNENIIMPDGPLTYTVLDNLILPKAILEGYYFLGWYSDPEYNSEQIYQTSTGDLTLYAKWLNKEEIGNKTIYLFSHNYNLKVGDTTTIYAKNAINYLDSKTLTYISLTPDILLIDNNGYVRALNKGTGQILVISTNASATININVEDIEYQVKWVGHQGSGGPVVQNTISAFKEGARRGYYAMETDIRVSADGVYYICHDDIFKSYLFTDSSLYEKAMAPYTWNQLKDLQVYDKYNGETYYATLTTVGDYLDICRLNGIKAVLELKWTTGINNNDQSKLSGLVQLVKEKGMYHDAIFLSSMKNCLTFIRNNYPDANIQFLSGTSTTTTENIEWCIENKFSLDAPAASITSEIVEKMHKSGLYVNAYTVNDVATALLLQQIKVDMITTDNLGI